MIKFPNPANVVKKTSIYFKTSYIRDVVISVPAYYHNGQRKSVRSVAKLAGLNPKHLVVEPSGAALYYWDSEGKPMNKYKRFLVFDFGGGTIDCSLMKCHGYMCSVLSVKGDNIGGIDIDRALLKIIINKFKIEHNLNFNNNSSQLVNNMLSLAEKVKESLTYNNKQRISCNNKNECKLSEHFDTIDKSIIIKRKEFENAISGIIKKAINIAVTVINEYTQSNIDNPDGKFAISSNIEKILMIGGSVKIPLVKKLLENEFNYGNIEIKFPTKDPQLMVVSGASTIGSYYKYSCAQNPNNCGKMGKIYNGYIIEDVIPLALGFNICKGENIENAKCGIMSVIVPKNTKYPAVFNDAFCQKEAHSTEALVELYEGESTSIKQNYFMGSIKVNNIKPRQIGQCPQNIKIKFEIDHNGIANITITTIGINDKLSYFTLQLPLDKDSSFNDEKVKYLKNKISKWIIDKSLRKDIRNL